MYTQDDIVRSVWSWFRVHLWLTIRIYNLQLYTFTINVIACQTWLDTRMCDYKIFYCFSKTFICSIFQQTIMINENRVNSYKNTKYVIWTLIPSILYQLFLTCVRLLTNFVLDANALFTSIVYRTIRNKHIIIGVRYL